MVGPACSDYHWTLKEQIFTNFDVYIFQRTESAKITNHSRRNNLKR
jgi:hypothetical protein